MGKSGRDLVKRRAKDGRTRYGPWAGAAVTAVVEVASWEWMSSLVPSLDAIPLWVLLPVAAAIAVLGALSGGYVEYLFRRWFVEPQRVIEELQQELTAYTEASRFILNPIPPIVFGKATKSEGDSSDNFTMCIVRLRVSNEGRPGAAFDWSARLECDNGFAEDARRVKLSDHNLHQAAVGTIPRDELISERTAQKIDRGDTVSGYFVGLFSEDAHDQLSAGYTLTIACRDYRERPAGIKVRRTPEGEDIEEVYGLSAPTLSNIQFDPDRSSYLWSGDDTLEDGSADE